MAERLAAYDICIWWMNCDFSGFFKDLGADKVITITLAEDLCL
ncbi:unnamed protein product, partial [Allacma fusca]